MYNCSEEIDSDSSTVLLTAQKHFKTITPANTTQDNTTGFLYHERWDTCKGGGLVLLS